MCDAELFDTNMPIGRLMCCAKALRIAPRGSPMGLVLAGYRSTLNAGSRGPKGPIAADHRRAPKVLRGGEEGRRFVWPPKGLYCKVPVFAVLFAKAKSSGPPLGCPKNRRFVVNEPPDFLGFFENGFDGRILDFG